MFDICHVAAKKSKNPSKIEWKNLHLKVKTSDPDKKTFMATFKRDFEHVILKNISGYVLPGSTTYIMGSSGCGKTTLLNALSGRVRLMQGDELSGTVKINEKDDLVKKNFGSIGAFVQQDDILFEHMKVKEALTFTARLKLTKLTVEEQDAKVNEVLNDLALVNCQNSLIGSVYRKVISGGERKRTAIGVEMLSDPTLLLLDEPTSGLDSFTALKIVTLMKKLAREKGLAIVATIH